jgi:hypothetical protein
MILRRSKAEDSRSPRRQNENRFLPRMYREDGTMERPRFEIQRGVVLLASIVFAGVYTNRLLLSTSRQ